jgi:hypothetical protein
MSLSLSVFAAKIGHWKTVENLNRRRNMVASSGPA